MRFFFAMIALWANLLSAYEIKCEMKLEETESFIHCLNSIENYPLKVHFFYPKNLITTNNVNLNIHFHGHNIEGYDHLKNFGNLLVKSLTNSILVVPDSIGKCATYDSFFKMPSDGIQFINNVISINDFKVSSLSFSGHSGAYRVLNAIFNYKNLKSEIATQIIGVGLFDATYAPVDALINFTLENKNFVFYDAYVSGEKGTTDDFSNPLKAKYSKVEKIYFYPIKSNSDSILDQHFELLQENGISVFLSKLIFN